MQKPTWRHHYIPIFYSQQWADPVSGLVHRYRRFPSKIDEMRVHPSRVGWAPKLYSLPEETGHAEQWLEEHYLKRLDDGAAPVLSKLLRLGDIELTSRDVGLWIGFILSLLNRSPAAIAAIKNYSRIAVREIVEEARERYSEMRGANDPATPDEFLTTRADVTAERTAIANFPVMMRSDAIFRALSDAPWAVYQVPKGQPGLLLSDHPIARTNGFLVEGGHLAMPLSPRYLLIIVRDQITAQRFDAMPLPDLCQQLNLETVRRAREFVVAADPYQAEFIREHFGSAAGPSHLFARWGDGSAGQGFTQ